MNEHLFIIYNLKPKLFAQSVDVLIRKYLSPYELRPLKNFDVITQSNQLLAIVCHCEISKLIKLCKQINS